MCVNARWPNTPFQLPSMTELKAKEIEGAYLVPSQVKSSPGLVWSLGWCSVKVKRERRKKDTNTRNLAHFPFPLKNLLGE